MILWFILMATFRTNDSYREIHPRRMTVMWPRHGAVPSETSIACHATPYPSLEPRTSPLAAPPTYSYHRVRKAYIHLCPFSLPLPASFLPHLPDKPDRAPMCLFIRRPRALESFALLAGGASSLLVYVRVRWMTPFPDTQRAHTCISRGPTSGSVPDCASA